MDQLDREESVGANTDFKTASSNTGTTGILREEIAASDCKHPLEFERLTLWPPVSHKATNDYQQLATCTQINVKQKTNDLIRLP